MIAIIAAIQSLAFVVATAWAVGSAARFQPVTPEEQERAQNVLALVVHSSVYAIGNGTRTALKTAI